MQQHKHAAAVTTWLFIKHELRKRLPAEEWKLWVFPARLLHVSPAKPWMSGCALDTLIIALPRSGRAVWKCQGRKNLVRHICLQLQYHIFFTMMPDDYDQARIVERGELPFEFLDPDPVHPETPQRSGRLAGTKRRLRPSRLVPPAFLGGGASA